MHDVPNETVVAPVAEHGGGDHDHVPVNYSRSAPRTVALLAGALLLVLILVYISGHLLRRNDSAKLEDDIHQSGSNPGGGGCGSRAVGPVGCDALVAR